MFSFLRTSPAQQKYTKVQTDTKTLLPPSSPEEESYNIRTAPHSLKVSLLQTTLLLLLFSTITFIAAKTTLKVTDKQCSKQLSVWSPALEAVEYIEYDLQNSFAEPSIYRGPPNPAQSQAWSDLWEVGAVRIPPEKMHLLNRTEEQANWKMIPEERGGGGYVALLDVFHQIHCLDLIRMYTWLLAGNYAEPGQGTSSKMEVPDDLRASDVGNRMHVDHCIETLRKTLMCHGDVTPFLSIRDPESPIGYRADFNMHQKCRDFEGLRGWVTENYAMP